MTEPSPASYCTCLALRKAARRVTQIYDAHLKPLDLRITQFAVLGQLAGNGAGPAAMSITALARRLGLDRSTLGRNIRPLLKAGLVAMEGGEDRRAHTLALTPAGQALFQRAVPLWREAQRSVSEKLGREKTRALRGMLDEATAILGRN
ncbi:MAG: winged helix-turn-helix transcriptional regulator [Rhodospirillaceae bacterium]|nr:winged helix-turn-helix transcriptional regulator [Rhodospirillaceae bacterium]